MNEIEWLVEQLKVRLPDVKIEVDAPERPKGIYWIDMKKGQKLLTFAWRSEQGFGFFSKDCGYGEGPEEIIPEKKKALEKVITLLLKNRKHRRR